MNSIFFFNKSWLCFFFRNFCVFSFIFFFLEKFTSHAFIQILGRGKKTTREKKQIFHSFIRNSSKIHKNELFRVKQNTVPLPVVIKNLGAAKKQLLSVVWYCLCYLRSPFSNLSYYLKNKSRRIVRRN